MTITIEQQIKAVRRELALRMNVYKKRVAAGQMTEAAANNELAAMQAVHDTISTHLPDLFGHDGWQELCEKDDRSSPADYPDMCLITKDELADLLRRHTPMENAIMLAQIKDLKERLTLAGIYLKEIDQNGMTWGGVACAVHAHKAVQHAIHPI